VRLIMRGGCVRQCGRWMVRACRSCLSCSLFWASLCVANIWETCEDGSLPSAIFLCTPRHTVEQSAGCTRRCVACVDRWWGRPSTKFHHRKADERWRRGGGRGGGSGTEGGFGNGSCVRGAASITGTSSAMPPPPSSPAPSLAPCTPRPCPPAPAPPASGSAGGGVERMDGDEARDRRESGRWEEGRRTRRDGSCALRWLRRPPLAMPTRRALSMLTALAALTPRTVLGCAHIAPQVDQFLGCLVTVLEHVSR